MVQLISVNKCTFNSFNLTITQLLKSPQHVCKCPLAIQELFLAFIAHIIHMASHQLCH